MDREVTPRIGTEDASERRLERLARLARHAGEVAVAEEARALSERVREGLFYVACVGQFKRGKSTLINALVGIPVLPAGVVPVTAVVTVVRYGRHPSARVRLADGGWSAIALDRLADFVSEERNPGNRKGVTAVEVFVPSPLLASGMCLVDTPGIGSVFGDNTEATRSFVPHVDAALVVLGADPPISGEELELVREIAARCHQLLFALNKADKISGPELGDADRFTRRILEERLGLRDVRLFEVSAKERLSGDAGPERGWPALVEALDSLARRSGSDLVRAAEERGLEHLADRLRRHLDERRAALCRPVEESERRIEELRRCVEQARLALADLDYLFAAEQDRLARAFAELKERFLRDTRAKARAELLDALRAHPARRGPALRRAAVRLALEIATRRLDAWLREVEPASRELYVRAMDRFVELANGFLERLRSSGTPGLEGLPSSVPPETGFRWDSRLFYKDLFRATGEGPFTWLIDRLRTRRSSLAACGEAASRYLQLLIETNATRIENDLNERVLESRRRFAYELRALLDDLVASASRSAEHARSVQARGRAAVAQELEHLDALAAQLDDLEITGTRDTSA
ncbi:MAG: hypothetical protein D6718_12195 [Acidobacteria bacterium]|nr:MAG: hypothetical protein D6718_12195 [Acidobacteriota bacterium]